MMGYPELQRLIRNAGDVAALAAIGQRLPLALAELVANDCSARDIGRCTGRIGEAIVCRLLVLSQQRLGSPPVPYAYLVAGSLGRLEATVSCDQDTALILDDRYNPRLHADYFRKLCQWVSDGMQACGYPYCLGRVMATNVEWCQPLRVWQDYFCRWVETPEPKALLNAMIFFDSRAIFGCGELCDLLFAKALGRVPQAGMFQALLARNAWTFKPALGMFGQLAAQRRLGERVLDLKKAAVVPVVDMARLYALAAGVTSRNTYDRIEAVTGTEALSSSDGQELLAAYEFISSVRLRNQVRQVQRELQPDNYLPLADLSAADQGRLRDALRCVRSLQRGMLRRYRDG